MNDHPPPIPPIRVRRKLERLCVAEYGRAVLTLIAEVVDDSVPLALDPAQPCRVGGGE